MHTLMCMLEFYGYLHFPLFLVILAIIIKVWKHMIIQQENNETSFAKSLGATWELHSDA